MSDKKRLLWRCRRGIREMDLLFKQYVTDHYDRLSKPEQQTLEDLLNEADLDIMNWIMGRSQPSRTEYLPILEQMKTLKEQTTREN